jgi:hypothetical protein
MKWEDAYALRDELTPFGAEGVGVSRQGSASALTISRRLPLSLLLMGLTIRRSMSFT